MYSYYCEEYYRISDYIKQIKTKIPGICIPNTGDLIIYPEIILESSLLDNLGYVFLPADSHDVHALAERF